MILDGAKIEFGLLIDKTIETDNLTATETDPSDFSNVYDTANNNAKEKIAYLENNYWLLDGSFVMPTDEDIAGSGDIINVAADSSFETDNWIISIDKGNYDWFWTINVSKNTAHAKVGTYSYLFDFSCAMGETGGGEVYAAATIFDTQTQFIASHKYYVRSFLFEEGNPYNYLSTNHYYIIGLRNEAGTYAEAKMRVGRKAVAGESWKYISNVVTGIENCKLVLGVHPSYRGGYVGNLNYKAWLDDLLIVDLTAKYGAGNEPSIDVCNRIFNNRKPIVIGYESRNTNALSAQLNYSFDNLHDSYGLTLIFPETSVPARCDVTYYKDKQIVGSFSLFLSERQNIYTDNQTILQWNRVVVELSNSSLFGRRIRMQQITFGVNDSYTENELIEISANKTLSVLSDYSENGEISFTFFNNGRYDIQTIKDLSQRVFEDLKTKLYVKKHLQSEYELWGTYYIESGKVEENGYIVSFTGHDGLYRLDDIMYERGRVYEAGRSLAEWARDVAKVAGVNIVVSDYFENVISKGYIAAVPCREAFRLIAEAGCGIFGIDENDVFHLWTYDERVIYNGEIDKTEIVQKSLSLENQNKIMGVRVTQYAFTRGESPIELGKVEGATLKSSGENIIIEFSDVPVVPESVEINTINGRIENVQIYSNKVSFTLSGTEGEQDTITITGIAYTSTENIIEREETKKNVKEIKENYLVTENLGDALADFQNLHSVKKYDYSAEIWKSDDINTGNSYTIQENRVIATNVAFSLTYDDYTETIQGIDE